MRLTIRVNNLKKAIDELDRVVKDMLASNEQFTMSYYVVVDKIVVETNSQKLVDTLKQRIDKDIRENKGKGVFKGLVHGR